MVQHVQDFVCEPVADVGIGVSTCFSLVSNVDRGSEKSGRSRDSPACLTRIL